MNGTVWSNGLEVTGGGTGIVSRAGPGCCAAWRIRPV